MVVVMIEVVVKNFFVNNFVKCYFGCVVCGIVN